MTPEQAAPVPSEQVTLPTLRTGALRALLHRGHLTPAQAGLARQLFAAQPPADDNTEELQS